MMTYHRRLGNRRREAIGRLVVRLMRDDSGVTSLQYFVAAVGLALVVVAAARPVAGILASFVYRVHVITTLAIP